MSARDGGSAALERFNDAIGAMECATFTYEEEGSS